VKRQEQTEPKIRAPERLASRRHGTATADMTVLALARLLGRLAAHEALAEAAAPDKKE
jgi:hypothetical protein